jgi:hypothetical protein
MRAGYTLAIVLLPLWTAPAAACSCARIAAGQVIGSAEVAFRGVVRAARVSADGTILAADVDVIERIKAQAPDRVTVMTSNTPGLCGYPLVADRSYVFAGALAPDLTMSVNMCGMVPLNPRGTP